MVHRIEVMLKKSLRDAFGEKIRKRINEDIHLPVRSVRTIKVFTIDAGVASTLVEESAGQLFCDSISQEYSINRPLADDFDWLIEVGFRPGVTDNEGKTARESLELAIGRKLNRGEGVYTSTQYALTGDLSLKDVERIATGLLANTLIQRFRIKGRSEWDKTTGMPPLVPRVVADTRPGVEEIDLAVSDERLL